MTKAKLGILISGRGSNMAAILDATLAPDCPYEIALVGSNKPDAAGLLHAADGGVPTWSYPSKGLERTAFDKLVDAALRKAGADYIALAGYMRILSVDFIAGWEGRILNIHPSLLPKYKGLDTHGRAIAAGDAVAGCSVHVVTPELDDGPVIAQAEVPILPGDTAGTLAERVLAEEHRLYPAAIAAYIRGRN